MSNQSSTDGILPLDEQSMQRITKFFEILITIDQKNRRKQTTASESK